MNKPPMKHISDVFKNLIECLVSDCELKHLPIDRCELIERVSRAASEEWYRCYKTNNEAQHG